jgi:hypothetical protein
MSVKIERTKATNAYDLLAEIADMAAVHPERINMSSWDARCGGPTSDVQKSDCGTVGCVAGWTCVLTETQIDFSRGGAETQIRAGAGNVLGLTWEQERELFLSLNGSDSLFNPNWVRTRPQTQAHGCEVRKHILAFMAKYEAQLKARAI